jgi:hypothetical protein
LIFLTQDKLGARLGLAFMSEQHCIVAKSSVGKKSKLNEQKLITN